MLLNSGVDMVSAIWWLSHRTAPLCRYLNIFLNKWIWRCGTIEWPPILLDLALLEFLHAVTAKFRLQAIYWLFKEIEDWYSETIFTVERERSNLPFGIATRWFQSNKTKPFFFKWHTVRILWCCDCPYFSLHNVCIYLRCYVAKLFKFFWFLSNIFVRSYWMCLGDFCSSL